MKCLHIRGGIVNIQGNQMTVTITNNLLYFYNFLYVYNKRLFIQIHTYNRYSKTFRFLRISVLFKQNLKMFKINLFFRFNFGGKMSINAMFSSHTLVTCLKNMISKSLTGVLFIKSFFTA